MKLSDTQLVILNAAAQRDRLVELPFPESVKRVRGGAATKVVDAMVAKGLLARTPARTEDPVWDHDDGEGALTLVATADGLAAIGIEPEDARDADGGRHGCPEDQGRTEAPRR